MSEAKSKNSYEHWKHLCQTDAKAVWFLTQDPMRVHHPTRRLVHSKLLQMFAGKLRKGGSLKLLDLGCGIGNEFYFLREKGLRFRYLGVDVTPRFTRVGKSMFHGARFVRSNAADLSVAKDSFDVVLIRHLLEHLTPQDAEVCINKALDAAKGAVILTMFNPFKVSGKVEVTDRGDYVDTTYPIDWLAQIVANRVKHTKAFQGADLEGNQVVILCKGCNGC